MSVLGQTPGSRSGAQVAVADPANSLYAARVQGIPGLEGLARLGALAGQLALLTLVIRQFEIESAAFLQLAVLAFAGFLVHSVLPMAYRLPFFVALSLAGVALVLGFQSGALLVGAGITLIGICHLPVSYSVRVVMLLLTAGALALMRVDWIPAPWFVAVWPILGSMFMFRLCVYVYDLKHDKEPPNVARTLAYFFMLPNVCFPLFPVIDFKTFRRTYYNEEAFQIYQNGIVWMVRGVVQLILYRVVYTHLTLAPSEVHDVPDLVQYMTSNFLLYLRVSGQFHLIVGMLHLFGFNLPPTHYLYFMASSFNDFWRRINIYWKDFMMKLFYYPAYFQLKRFGATTALVISTFIVFGSTWILHSYQWFWLRGTFPINWQDGVFWGVLAILVVANSLHEARYGRARSIGKRQWTAGALASVSLRTFATFCVICVLWSLWTSDSLADWLALWSLPGGWGVGDMASVASVVALGVAWFGTAAGSSSPAPANRPTTPGARPPGFWRTALITGFAILVVYAAGLPQVYSRLGAQGELIESVRTARLNARDASQLEAGYYEGLLRVERFNSELWNVYVRNPVDVNEWGESGRTIRWTTDLRMKELRPDLITEMRNAFYSTNRWGMRDQDYEQKAEPRTQRIALMGSSIVMGSAVADGQNFETLLEARLNRERVGSQFAKYEILNMSVGGYGPIEQAVVLEERVFGFEPSTIFYIAHFSDTKRAIEHLAKAVVRGFDLRYDTLRHIAAQAGVDASMTEEMARGRLTPFGPETVSFVYGHIVAQSKARGITPVWIYLPSLGEDASDNPATLIQQAHDAGFHVVDISDVWQGFDKATLRVSVTDSHPNATGHRIIEERLYRALVEFDADTSVAVFDHQQ